MAAEAEEVVAAADTLDPQELAPEAGQSLLGGRARRLVRRPAGAFGAGVRVGQRPAVDLAVRAQGQRGEHRHRRGHQVARQPAGEGAPELLAEAGGLLLRSLGGDDVGVEPAAPGGVPARHHHRRGHPRVRRQAGLDLSRLDPEAPDLDLLVDPPQELDLPAPSEAHPVARAIEPLARPLAPRVWGKALGGEPRPVPVAPGEPFAGRPELPRHPDRHRLEAAVEHVHPGVGDRPPDGNRADRPPSPRSPSLPRGGKGTVDRIPPTSPRSPSLPRGGKGTVDRIPPTSPRSPSLPRGGKGTVDRIPPTSPRSPSLPRGGKGTVDRIPPTSPRSPSLPRGGKGTVDRIPPTSPRSPSLPRGGKGTVDRIPPTSPRSPSLPRGGKGTPPPVLRRRGQGVAGGEGRVLRRAVAVRHPAARHLPEHPLDRPRRQHVAPREELAQAGQGRQVVLDHLVEEAGGQPERRDPLPGERSAELAERRQAGPADRQAAAVQERSPDLQGRGVERDRGELQESLPGAELRAAGFPDQAHDPAVRHGDPVRAAGRARGVHDVGEALAAPRRGSGPRRVRRRRPRLPRLVLDPAGRLEPHDGQALGRQGRERLLLADEHREARVLQHEGETLARVARVEGHVGTARLEDGEHRHRQGQRALDAQAHPRLRADAGRAQAAGERARAALELPVAERRAPGRHRHRLGRPRRLGGEQLLDRGPARIARRRVVPLPEELPALAGAEERQAEGGGLRRRRCGPQEAFEVTHQAPDGGRVEEAPVVLEIALEPPLPLHQEEAQVDLGASARDHHQLGLEAGQAAAGEGRVLEPEQHLEDGRAGEVPVRMELLDQAVERDGVLLRFEEVRGRAVDELREARVVRELAAQREGVDEHPDQPLEVPPRPVGDRRADHRGVVAGVAGELGVEGGEQDDEQGRPAFPGEARRGRPRAPAAR